MQQVSRRHFMFSSAAIGAAASVGLVTPSVLASTEFVSQYPIPKSGGATFIEFSNFVHPDSNAREWNLAWEIAEDPNFANIVNSDSITYPNNGEDLVSVRLERVPEGKKLYYRVNCNNCFTEEQNILGSELKAKQFVVFPAQEITAAAGDNTIDPVVERSY